MEDRQTITLCFILCEEYTNLIDTIKSAKGFVDEVVILGDNLNAEELGGNNEHTKIIACNKDENLSKQKNRALENSTSDWILFLQSNEVLEQSHIESIKTLVEDKKYDIYYFNVKNYYLDNLIDKLYEKEIRLIRNTKEYEFIGILGEEVYHCFKKTKYERFKEANIVITANNIYKNNYISNKNITGVLNEIERTKNYYYKLKLIKMYSKLNMWTEALKISREIPLSNILNSEDIEENMVLRAKILFKTDNLTELEEMLNDRIIDSLEMKELYYYKAKLYYKRNYIILAIRYYKIFLANLNNINKIFLSNNAISQTYEEVGNLYYREKSFEDAMEYYDMYVKKYGYRLEILYKYIICLFKVYSKDEAIEKTKVLFNLETLEGLSSLAELLYTCEVYDYALVYFIEASKKEISDKILIRIGQLLMINKDYKNAKEIFNKIPENSQYIDEARQKLLLIKTILKENVEKDSVNKISNTSIREALNILIFKENLEIENIDKLVNEYMKILDEFLKCKEYESFQNALEGLNYINSESILRELAIIYKNNNLQELAKDTTIKSIEKFNKISKKEIDLLYHNC